MTIDTQMAKSLVEIEVIVWESSQMPPESARPSPMASNP